MAGITATELKAYGASGRVFIETGTYEARSAIEATKIFPIVHTIELSRSRYDDCLKKHWKKNISFHYGDSRDLLGHLLALYTDACWFLDAHWCESRLTVADTFPLWEELEILAGQFIIVDDVHAFGRIGTPWEDMSKLPPGTIKGDHYVVNTNRSTRS